MRAARRVAGEKYGDDRQALKTFIAAAEAGLPCFTEGVNTLFDRLSFYQMSEAAGIDGPLLDSAMLARQRELMARLRRFAPACDQSAILTSFWGADPNVPDLEEATTEQTQESGGWHGRDDHNIE